MLVDGYDKSLLGTALSDPAQREMERVVPHDHCLQWRPCLDREASLLLPLQVRVERGATWVGGRSIGHRSSAVPSSPPTRTLIVQRPTSTTSCSSLRQ